MTHTPITPAPVINVLQYRVEQNVLFALLHMGQCCAGARTDCLLLPACGAPKKLGAAHG